MPKVKSYNEQSDVIVKLFRVALAEKGWNQAHLAKVSGLTNAQVSAIFKNPSKHHFESVALVARKLGVNNIPIL